MSRRRICLLLCGLAVSAGHRDAVATVFLHEQFLEDGPLETKVPMPGPGNAWTGGGGTSIPVQVAGGEAVVVQTDAGLNGREASNEFVPQSATATTFARFDFRLPAADNATVATDPDVADEGVFFISLRGSGASALRARTGILAPTAGGDFRLALNSDVANLALGAIWPTELDFDTTYRAVISHNAADSVSKLWLNAVDETSASIMHTGATLGTLIDRITLRQADDYAGKQLVDNVVVATTFAEALSGGATAVPGDYNGNGTVDAADYVVWRENLTQTGVNPADGNGDMTVDNLDYGFWGGTIWQPNVSRKQLVGPCARAGVCDIDRSQHSSMRITAAPRCTKFRPF